ncbi:MAG: CBS domain-containing protein [Thermoplasmatales archaeon]|nr:MAG: CBS domain-containing protein [Thermoplasmatales archaeon]
MLVKKVMTKNIVMIEADKSVYDAAVLIREKKITSVIVLDKKGDVGLVTRRENHRWDNIGA